MLCLAKHLGRGGPAMPHFSQEERSMMDKSQKQGNAPQDILRPMAHQRRRRGEKPPSSSAVYRYLKGETYDNTAEETRGRPSKFGRREMAVYDRARRKLQAEAANEFVVTWGDIAERGRKELRKRKLLDPSEGGLSAEWLRKRMRADLGVGKRPAPQLPVRTKDEEKRRLRRARVWSKFPKSFWVDSAGNGIHCYIDNKKLVMARTAAQRKRARQARVRHHLRKPEERTMEGYTVPKKGA